MRRYTFKLYPNSTQAAELDRVRRSCCALYNAALQERIDQWRHECQRKAKADRRGLTCYDQGKSLKYIRADDPFWAALPQSVAEDVLVRVDNAYKAFFRRAKAGAGASSGFPKFQRSDDYAGFGMRRMGSGWHFDMGRNRLRIKGISGLIKARGKSPAMPEDIRTATLSYRTGIWELSLSVEIAHRMAAISNSSGKITLDLVDCFAVLEKTVDGGCPSGLDRTVFTVRDGQIISANQGFTVGGPAAAMQMQGNDGCSERLRLTRGPAAAMQTQGNDRGTITLTESAPPAATSNEDQIRQAMSRCKRGSYRYRALRLRLARVSKRRAARLKEAQHLVTTNIAREFSNITIITPDSIAEITASGHGTVRDHGAETDLKAAFNRRVLSQSPYAFTQMLKYKIEERGGHISEEKLSDHKAAVGNAIVEARKKTRKLKRSAKHA
ncbi:MAG: RNA-guided endonuclease InsQ/TnpB family protein [Rhizomicrobium sp.]